MESSSASFFNWDLVCSSAGPRARCAHTLVVHEGVLYSFGGFDGANSDELWAFNQGKWQMVEKCSGDAPTPRCRHYSFVHAGKMFVYAGWSREGPRRDMLSFDFETRHWDAVTFCNFGPPARRYQACCYYKSQLWVFGGWDGVFLDDLHVLDLQTLTWRKVTAKDGPSMRCYHSLVAYDGCLYVFGGTGQQAHLNDLYRFDIKRERWQKVKVSGEKPRKRYAHSAVVTPDGKMAVFGGCCQQGIKYNDMHLFDFSSSSWSRVPTSGFRPSPRSSHAAVIHGQSMFVFGGYDGRTRFNQLYKVPVLLLWSPATHMFFDAHLRWQIRALCMLAKRPSSLFALLPNEVLFQIFRFLCLPPVKPFGSVTTETAMIGNTANLLEPSSDGCEQSSSSSSSSQVVH